MLYENIENVIKFGITEEEIAKAKEVIEKSTHERINKLGFSGSRTELLGEGLLFKNNPGYYHLVLKEQAKLTHSQVQAAAIKWLNNKGARVLLISNK
jgi:hypothetical protein